MISPTVTILGVSLSVSRTEKAIVEPCSCGCAEAWHGDGSIDLKLWTNVSCYSCTFSVVRLHFPKIVSEVGESILAVADELRLRLGSMVFFPIDVRQY